MAAGLILAAVAGVGFLAWTVPRQLDLILANQKQLFEHAAAVEARLDKAEEKLQGIDSRLNRVEARR